MECFVSNQSSSSPLLCRSDRSNGDRHLTIDVRYCANGNHGESNSHRHRRKFEFTVDPFRNSTPNIEGIYEVLKIIICLPIAVLRLLLFGVSLLVGYLTTLLATHNWNDNSIPMPRWRSQLMWVTRLCARGILFSFGYHWIRRVGKPAPREIAPIVVSNHISYIEPIFFFYDLYPTIVASESHDSLPFVGTIIRAMQVIYVDRFSPSSRKHAVDEIKRRASNNRFPQLLLFPEGTTTNGKALLSFKLGAFIPGCVIQPVVVRYPFVHFDQSWGDISLLKLMLRMFLQFHNFMQVEYLPIIYPSDYCREDPSYFSLRVSDAMATCINVVQTSYSFGDMMLFMKAREAKHANPSSFMVEMARVETLFDISNLEALSLLEIFLSMDPDSSGCINFSGFSMVLGFKNSSVTEEIFRLLDKDQTGMITFKQFVYAFGHLLRHPFIWQTLDAFFVQDNNDNHEISEQEFEDIVRQITQDMENSEIHGLFEMFDCNRNGRVNRDDFMSLLRKNPLLMVYFIPLSGWKSLQKLNR